jgi:O-phosphoseryl-tRNA synthetase
MTKFDTKKIKEDAEKDFEKTWLESSRLIKKEGKFFNLLDKRKEHALFDLIIKARKVLLDLGFTEVIAPSIVQEQEVWKQYGPETPIILDRVYFLAGTERPDIGINKRKVQQIKKIVPGFEKIEKLQEIFRRYKKGEIVADDLVEAMVKELKIKEEQATEIISKVFPEFKKLKPIPSQLTLRSHTTSLWFPILAEMQKREALPIQLFSIGQKFRREQKLDPTHLYESWTASFVVMAEEISLEDGKQIVKEFLSKLGFDEIRFATKEATSKYYASQTEFEVFVKTKAGEEIEVGNGGFYNPVALSNYDISYPVFNFGAGLERILMVKLGAEDIRKLVYPYFYEKVEFSDFEIANSIKLIKEPETGEGKVLVGLIVKEAVEHAEDPTPAKIIIYKGEFLNRRIEVKLFKEEPNKKLLGPAALNPIVVKDGNVIGAIPSQLPENSTRTDFTYMLGIANLTAYEIEKAIAAGKKEVLIEVKDAKSLTDVNLQIEEVVRRYIESKNKLIDIRGPVFVWIKAIIE